MYVPLPDEDTRTESNLCPQPLLSLLLNCWGFASDVLARYASVT